MAPGVAILSMALRVPGARTADELWDLLAAGKECISTVTGDPSVAASRRGVYVPAAGVLDGVYQFDHGFFAYTERNAVIADPQQRLSLECAWEALELSGYLPGTRDRKVGVFAGVSRGTYSPVLAPQMPAPSELELRLGNDPSVLSGMISYRLGLTGPSATIQSACSSSLVALHSAVESLLRGECELAVVIGAAVKFPHDIGYWYLEDGIYSPDGHCRPFDRSAAGTVGGSGVLAMVLKRENEAIRDGDSAYAVVAGSSVNNSGGHRAGFTAPNVTGQVDVIRAALIRAELAPTDVRYVEAHGTGTSLGDAIEVAALAEVFESLPGGTVTIGSIKGNVGHLDAASGMAGLAKAALSIERGSIPPSINCDDPRDELLDVSCPLRVLRNAAKIDSSDERGAVGISSFGISGTNAHVVLRPFRTARRGAPVAGSDLIVLSGRSLGALGESARLLSAEVQRPELALEDISYTLQVGRRTFPHRFAVRASDRGSVVAALREFSRGVAACGGPVAPPPGMVLVLGDRLNASELMLVRCLLRAEGSLGIEAGGPRSTAALRSAAESAQRGTTADAGGAVALAVKYVLAARAARGDGCRIVGEGHGQLAAVCVADDIGLEAALDRLATKDPQESDSGGRDLASSLDGWAENGPALFVSVGAPIAELQAFETTARLAEGHAVVSVGSEIAVEPDGEVWPLLEFDWLTGGRAEWPSVPGRGRLRLPTAVLDRAYHGPPRSAGAASPVSGSGPRESSSRRGRQEGSAEGSGDVIGGLRQLIANELGSSEVGLDDDFLALGLDSVAMLNVAADIAELWGVDVSMAEMFEHSSVRALAGLLDARGKAGRDA